MAYRPRSLFSLIEEINRSLFLPHIQRPFVWEMDQILKFFDSLMRSYPVQTFLFWRTKEAIKARKFMDPIRWDPALSDYYDKQVSAKGREKIFVLDGQQRLQSLYAIFACQGRTESTSVAAAKTHQFEGWREWWFGFWQGEREGDLPLAIALSF